ncbi:uncharacterized protein AMSG_12120, partial [Thecamonas trahens ATCC 50062]
MDCELGETPPPTSMSSVHMLRSLVSMPSLARMTRNCGERPSSASSSARRLVRTAHASRERSESRLASQDIGWMLASVPTPKRSTKTWRYADAPTQSQRRVSETKA